MSTALSQPYRHSVARPVSVQLRSRVYPIAKQLLTLYIQQQKAMYRTCTNLFRHPSVPSAVAPAYGAITLPRGRMSQLIPAILLALPLFFFACSGEDSREREQERIQPEARDQTQYPEQAPQEQAPQEQAPQDQSQPELPEETHSGNLEATIEQFLSEKRYEEALGILRESDGDTEELESLKVRTHLAYANYLTHEADHLGMGERMADALKHFRRVVELDPDNSQAQTHIDLIEGIYEQMDRDIPEGIAE